MPIYIYIYIHLLIYKYKQWPTHFGVEMVGRLLIAQVARLVPAPHRGLEKNKSDKTPNMIYIHVYRIHAI